MRVGAVGNLQLAKNPSLAPHLVMRVVLGTTNWTPGMITKPEFRVWVALLTNIHC